MAPTIGSYSFIAWNGAPLTVIAEAVEVWRRMGVNGEGLRRTGKAADPVAVETVADFTTQANALTALDGYRGIQGTLVTVTDGSGGTRNNVLVERVVGARIHQVVRPVGGQGDTYLWLLRAQWTLRPTA